jgi:hypothetical protein
MGSKPLLSASLRRPFGGPHKHATRPCRNSVLSCLFDKRKLCIGHTDFKSCILAFVGWFGRPTHSFVFHADIVRKKSFDARVDLLLFFRTISADKETPLQFAKIATGRLKTGFRLIPDW